jgi:hypothetical protein
MAPLSFLAKRAAGPLTAAAAFLLLAPGCSSSSASPAASDGGADMSARTGDSAVVSCAGDPRVDPYALPLARAGTGKALTFSIVQAISDPPTALTTQIFKVKITDASGQPVAGATLTFPKIAGLFDPYMPDHHHGGPPPVVADNGDGTYTLSAVDFFMSGVWQLGITAQSGSTTDSVMYGFCIP